MRLSRTATSALAISLGLTLGLSASAIPAMAEDGSADPRATADKVVDSLPSTTDLGDSFHHVAASDPIVGKGTDFKPDLCPLTRRAQTIPTPESFARWMSTASSNDSPRKRSIVVDTTVWSYPAGRFDTPAKRDEALSKVRACPDKAQVRPGLTARFASEITPRATTQWITVNSKRNESVRSSQSVSWRIAGRYLVRTNVSRVGATIPRTGAQATMHARTADRLSSLTAERLLGKASVAAPPEALTPEAPEVTAPVVSVGQPWAVSLGDSFISGEGGAWMGNVENSLKDSLVWRGADTYFDFPDLTPGGTMETITGCHRSDTAAIHIGILRSVNLACSGAITTSKVDDKQWKPGIDFGTEPQGSRRGQVQLLREFAEQNRVELVSLSIGGNNVGFSTIIKSCLGGFLLSTSLFPDYCSKDPKVMARISQSARDRVASEIAEAIGNVNKAMSDAGYTPEDWTLVVHNYPSPMPEGDKFRYSESLFRQSDGGCGFWNKDATWANEAVLPAVNGIVTEGLKRANASNAILLDLSDAFKGNRLCEKGTVSLGTSKASAIAPWDMQKRFKHLEWVAQIRTLSTFYSGQALEEGMHPNALGQLAIRNCLRQAYQADESAKCVRADDELNEYGEPNMRLK